ncbi:MAG: cell division protein CrgA [Actinomycetota bacterium]|mgnify:FL=1
MAPPKRKSTGRVTPKGTRPGESNQITSHASAHASEHGAGHTVGASSRYTPPTTKAMLESPRWVPILMTVLIALGVLVILLRYVIWQDTNLPVLFGLGFLLAGLYTATKWH